MTTHVAVAAFFLWPILAALPPIDVRAGFLAQGRQSAEQQGVRATGAVAGVVSTADTSAQPVQRAIVTLAGGDLVSSISAITDDAGRFAFDSLQPGRYVLVAAKPGFVTTAYGAKFAGRPGTAIVLDEGQKVADLMIPLARGAVITGRVRNVEGSPAPGIRVAAVRAGPMRRSPELSSGTDSVVTDDQGEYRLFGLAPGRYLVVASTRTGVPSAEPISTEFVDATLADLERRRSAGRVGTLAPLQAEAPRGRRPEVDGEAAYAPVFFPSVSDPAQAGIIAVSAGEERTAADIVWRPMPVASITGAVVSSAGSSSGVRVGLAAPRNVARFSSGGTNRTAAAATDPQGRFRIDGVTPGVYKLWARSMDQTSWATADITVAGDDISGVQLRLSPTIRISGIVKASEGNLPAGLAARLRVGAVGAVPSEDIPDLSPFQRTASSPVSADGTFELVGVFPGSYRLVVTLPPKGGWSLRSAVAGGRDVLDFGLEVGDDALAGVVVTLSEQRSRLSGVVLTPHAVPATDYHLVVIPANREYWRPASRRLAFTRADTTGRFVFEDLPAGDYYLAALADFDSDEWPALDLLNSLITAGIKLTLADGEQKVQNIQIAGGAR